MNLQARRVFRLAGTMALSLAIAYGMGSPLAFLAPLFALLLALKPAPPMRLKALLGLTIAVAFTLSTGLLLIPVLEYYPVAAILLVGLGLFVSFHLTVGRGQMLVGMFLTIGITLISAAGTASQALANALVEALLAAMVIAHFCQRVLYFLFPEDPLPPVSRPPPAPPPAGSDWISLRGTLIVLPVYLLALTNPSAYIATIMKSVSLAQQSSQLEARSAGRELLGSTFLGGVFAVLFWIGLQILPNLWMFTLWMLLFGIYFAAKIYRVLPTRYPASYWLNVAITLLILLGPAVEDIASGKDVYQAFFVRLSLFVAVTLYAWLAVYLFDTYRSRRCGRALEAPSC